ncbi:MAG: DUF2442 domain-containing protein [Fibrella sp.]|nr:DUF2442 domain-containing protein [Armatimonadota bacterium]
MPFSPPIDFGERVVNVVIARDTLTVTVIDGRVVTLPLTYLPLLNGASDAERQNFQIVSGGFGIRWLDLGANLTTTALLRGAQIMRRPQPELENCFLWREPGERLRVMGEGQLDLAQRSVDAVVERATAHLAKNGVNLAIYDGVSVRFYADRLPDYVTGVPQEPAWLLWFWLSLAPGIEIFPEYTDVVVLDRSGAVAEPHMPWSDTSKLRRKKRSNRSDREP